MAQLPKRRKWIGIAAVVFAAACLVGYLFTRPLTPERARAALGEHFPELRDAPIVRLETQTVLVDDCRCDLTARTWHFDPPRPHPDYALSRLPGGHFHRGIFGGWEATQLFNKISVD